MVLCDIRRARCEPVPAFPLIPDPSTYPAWSLRHPSLPGVSRFPRSCCYLHAPSPERPSVEHPPARGAVCGTSDGAWDIRRHVEHSPTCGTFADMWNIAEAWNIAVRTRGVFTHRTGFLKPACVERGLVRTGSHQAEPQKPESRAGAHGHRGLWFDKEPTPIRS